MFRHSNSPLSNAWMSSSAVAKLVPIGILYISQRRKTEFTSVSSSILGLGFLRKIIISRFPCSIWEASCLTPPVSPGKNLWILRFETSCIAYRGILTRHELYAIKPTFIAYSSYVFRCKATFSTIPNPKYTDSRELTPLEKKGKVIPVFGKSPVATAILVYVWKPIHAITPTHINRPLKVFAL